MTIARKVRYPDVTQNQMVLALVRENMQEFRTRSVHRLNVGSRLTIPSRATVAATDAPTADREVAAYLEAGKQGHALAELRLGELYDRGSPAVQRDVQESARWYESG
jgi:FimV-like protein